MFSKARRLTGKAVIFVSRRGNVLSGPGIRIKWVRTSGPASRATVVASLAFDKRATRRNRIKRQLREIIRPLLGQMKPPINLVVSVDARARDKKFKVIQTELMSLLIKGRLLLR